MNLITLLFILSLFSCIDKMTEKWYSIKFENNTLNALLITAGCPRYDMPSYPDTILPVNKPSLTTVRPSDYNYLDHSLDWELVINNNLQADTLSIYVFDAKFSWDSIRSANLVIKRYDLSLQDLENSNWSVSYP